MWSLHPFLTTGSRAPCATPTTGWRQDVCPPSLQSAALRAVPGWRRWFAWAPRRRSNAAGSSAHLANAREEFARALADLGTQHAAFLQRRLCCARSMRELWYLRSEMFSLIAVQHSESEAERRMAALNRHFPTRTPGSSFMPLNG